MKGDEKSTYLVGRNPVHFGFDELQAEYDARRTMLCDTLETIGFRFARPQGAYYVLAGFEGLSRTREGFHR